MTLIFRRQILHCIPLNKPKLEIEAGDMVWLGMVWFGMVWYGFVGIVYG